MTRPEVTPLGPWPDGIVRMASDRSASTNMLYDGSGYVGTTVGSLVGVYDALEIVRFLDNTPTRWIQWENAYVQLNSKPVSEVVYNTAGGTAELLIQDEGRAVVYDNKLFVAIPGQPARVYPDRNDLTRFSYLSEKVFSILEAAAGGPATVTAGNIAFSGPENFGQDPQYIMFDRDGDKGATSAEVRPVTGFTGPNTAVTNITFTGSIPAGVLAVRVIVGLDANDLLEPEGFFVWRERLGMWHDNKIQFAGFPGAGSIGSDFQDPNELDWTVWDALNFRPIGEEKNDGTIKRVLSIEDRIVIGLSGDERAAIYDMRGYPPINAQFENQLVVEKRSSRTGFQSYDSVSVDRDGQAIFFSFGDGFWVFQGINATRIDDNVEEHPLFSRNFEYVALTDELIVFAEGEYVAERVPREAQALKSGINQQVPAAFILDLKSSSWRLTQRIGTNLEQEVCLFDSPGHTGGLGVLFFNNERKIAVGSGSSLWTLQDEDLINVPIDNMHLQWMQTHRHDFGIPYAKRQEEITVHARQRFNLRLPVVVPAEGNNGVKRDHFSLAKIRDTLGDLSIYATFTKGGKGSPRVSLGLGYFGEALLAGQDRNFAEYDNFTVDDTAPLTLLTGGTLGRRGLGVIAGNDGLPDWVITDDVPPSADFATAGVVAGDLLVVGAGTWGPFNSLIATVLSPVLADLVDPSGMPNQTTGPTPLPGTGDTVWDVYRPAATFLQAVSLSGRVDRIDVYAANVTDLTVLIYEDNAGVPGSLLHVSHLKQPKYGLRPASDYYWFPITFGVDLDGDYFIEVRGNADVRYYAGPTDIIDQFGQVVFSGSSISFRAIQHIGAPYVSDEIVGAWTNYTVLGETTW